jgi:hypothetical protein
MVVNIKDALEECADHARHVRRRNSTLIDYYIDREPVPTAIATYDPALSLLESRIKLLKKLHFRNLEQLIDDPDCLAARHLLSIIADLFNAIVGFKELFEVYYDPGLRQRGPYVETSEDLEFLETRLRDLIQRRQSNPSRPRAEDLIAQPRDGGGLYGPGQYAFCRGAVQVLNGSDRGHIGVVSQKDLLLSNRECLSLKGGAYLWWICPDDSCRFKLRFHAPSSYASSINTTSEVRTHGSLPIEYRSAFLIESHLHSTASSSAPRPRSIAAKYGCIFCFAEGRPLVKGITVFGSGKDLAMHICVNHTGENRLPPALMLERARVAVGRDNPVGVTRWDVHLPSEV